jgi:rhamnose utilization protein RhaD (predicted bifunctional aldolase and dehydrogenase)
VPVVELVDTLLVVVDTTQVADIILVETEADTLEDTQAGSLAVDTRTVESTVDTIIHTLVVESMVTHMETVELIIQTETITEMELWGVELVSVLV